MQKRPYGNTGIDLSLIAMGGIVVMGVEQYEADRRTREAFDRGINYYDVAPSYGDAEERLGPALVGLREQIFLACKTGKRSKQEAAQEMRDSLRRLRTNHFDLFQLHAVSSVEEAETCLGPNGALEALVEAREEGLIRYIGFSAHSAEAALLLLEQFSFDSILFPFNFSTWHGANFGPQVLAKAEEKGVARFALKAMARRPWQEGADRTAHPNCWYQPLDDPAEMELALRWTLSLPITAAVPPGDYSLYRQALDFADRFTPLSASEQEAVKQMAQVNAPIFTLAAS